FLKHLGIFHRARAGDHAQVPAADAHLANLNDRVLAVELAAGELERLQDRQHLFDAGNGLELLGLHVVLVADDPANRPVLAAAAYYRPVLGSADVRLEPQLRDALHDMGDLFRGGLRIEHDDHGINPPSPRTANRVAGL